MTRFGRSSIGLMVLFLAGCGWLQAGFDAGRAGVNDFEHKINVGNVALLTHRTIPTQVDGDHPAEIIVGSHLVGVHNGHLAAYDAGKCPTPSSAACTPIWETPTIPPIQIASDGGAIFATGPGPVSHDNTLYATDSGGTPTWSAEFPYLQGTDNPYLDGLAVAGGHTVFGIGNLHHGTSYRDRSIHVFATQGCGAASCQPLHTIQTLGTANIAADAHRVYALVSASENGTPTTRVEAFDLDTGARVWESAWNVVTDSVIPPSASLVIRGTRLYAQIAAYNANPAHDDVYDLAATCPGTPAMCTSTGTFGDSVAAVTQTVTVTTAADGRLLWYDTSSQTCAGVPTPCVPFASTAANAAPSGVWAIANGVMIAVRGAQLLAFDEHGAVGCSGAPKICAPLFTFDLGTNASTMNVSVWDGRLYARTRNFTTAVDTEHVFVAPS